eukprot:2390706-Prymnesium_polylepis.2
MRVHRRVARRARAPLVLAEGHVARARVEGAREAEIDHDEVHDLRLRLHRRRRLLRVRLARCCVGCAARQPDGELGRVAAIARGHR